MGDDLEVLTEAENPVVFFANGIGDAILTLPALRALTEVFPERLTLVTHGSAGYVDLLKPLATKRQLYIESGTKCDWEEDYIKRLAATIGKCDLFVSLVAWHSQSLGYLIDRLAPARSIGYSPRYDFSLPRDYTKHTAELTFDAVRTISPNLSLRDYLDPPTYPEGSVRMAQEVRSALGHGVRLLAVHMETLPEKLWDPARLSEFLDRFLVGHPDFIAMFVNHSEYSLTLQSETLRERVITQRGLSLQDALCLVHYADCFLGADSCMLHAADFGRVPAVGLFGATSAAEFGFLVGPHVVIQTQSDVKEIEVSTVLAAMDLLLEVPNQRAVWTQ
jgi:ADP-heptose:LPS heptosyltransferase